MEVDTKNLLVDVSDENDDSSEGRHPIVETFEPPKYVCHNPLRIIGVQPESPLAWSPDGTKMAFVLRNHSICLTAFEGEKAFEYERILSHHVEKVNSIIFHPKEPYLISGGIEGMVVWNWQTGQIIHEMKTECPDCHFSAVECLLWLFDGIFLVSGSKDTNIKIWNVEEKFRLMETVDAHKAAVLSLAFNPTNLTITTAGRDSSIRFWDVSSLTGEKLEQRKDDATIKVNQVGECAGHRGDVLCSIFSQDGQFLFSGARDNSIIVWDAINMTQLRTLTGHRGDVTSLKLIPGQNMLVSSGNDSKIIVWKLAKPKTEHRKLVDIDGLVDSPDEEANTIVSDILKADEYSDLVGTAELGIPGVHNENADTILSSFPAHSFDCSTMVFAPNSPTMVTSTSMCALRGWDIADLNNPKVIREFVGHQSHISAVVLIDQDNSFFSGSFDYNASYYDVNSMRRWMSVPSTGSIHSLAYGLVCVKPEKALTPDKSDKPYQKLVFVGGTDYVIRAICLNFNTPDSFKIVCSLDGHNGRVEALAVSPLGNMIASGSHDFTLKTWKLQGPYLALKPSTLRPDHTYSQHRGHILALSFNEDGKLLASASADHSIIVWKAAGSRLSAMWNIARAHDSVVSTVAFGKGISKDLLVSGSWDARLKVWDVMHKGDTPSMEFKDHSAKVTAVDISKDGKYLVSASADSTIRIFDLEDGGSKTAVYPICKTEGSLSCLSVGENLFVSGAENGLLRVWPLPNKYLNLFEEYHP